MSGEQHATGDRVHKVEAWASHEIKRYLVMFVYLWVLLGLFVLNEAVILSHQGIDYRPHGFALINALVLAKVMLIAEDLNLGARLRSRPLIYPIVTEALLLSGLFIIFHIAEREILGLFHGESIAAAMPSIGGGGIKGLFCVAVILFVSLVPFFAFRRVSRELGPGRMRAMLLGAPVPAAHDG
ncbi:MAG: hypothetical protein JOY64_10915 [Alphaproteobacteria bacterium]|nr:hypothetical protein [Alphaproteobacteria bacterium]MBV8408132.1 hypothetical protein [Alphaproteobacteria bacterium]